MSKEYLETLEKIKQEFNCDPEYYGLGGAFEIIESALRRLESIDNANPSEALECLMYLKAEFRDYPSAFNSIKNALLKAQEPKKYLKWEDLEFKEKAIYKRVTLNGELYLLKTYRNFILCFDIVELEKTDGTILFHINQYNLQFFNDLHLERVEE